MAKSDFEKFFQLAKVDIAKRQVWGTAAVEEVDQVGEIMDYAKSAPNFKHWSSHMEKSSGGKSKGNVREMHQESAVGRVIHFETRDDQRDIFVGVEVVDDQAWRKVLTGVYTGFSVGGKYGAKWPDQMNKNLTRYEAKPTEISLVDKPCMPGALFEVVKADGTTDMRKIAQAFDDLDKGDFEGHPFRGNQWVTGQGVSIKGREGSFVVMGGGTDDYVFVKPAGGGQDELVERKSLRRENYKSWKERMFTESDYKYFKDKGYSEREILEFWDRDFKEGKAPLIHKPIPDVVGVIADPDFYKKNSEIFDLIKGASMDPTEVLLKMEASTDPAVVELAGELRKGFPPPKKKDGDKQQPDETDDKSAEGDKSQENSDSPEDEAGQQPGTNGDENNPDAEANADTDSEEQNGNPAANEGDEQIRSVVINLLEELGLVQRQGDAMKVVIAGDLAKRLEGEAVSDLKARLEKLDMARQQESDGLKKSIESANKRSEELTNDLATVVLSVQQMEKRGGPAPILRDLGAFPVGQVADLQKVDSLKDILGGLTDPNAIQAIQGEITRLEIKIEQQTKQSNNKEK